PAPPGRLRPRHRAAGRALPAPGAPGDDRRGRPGGDGAGRAPARDRGPAVIALKSAREIGLMREAGQILVAAIRLCEDLVKPGIATLEIDREIEALIRERHGTPAFKGYRGFPATICASINEEVVHGIPAAHRRLREGDIIGLDLGAIVEGYYADAAVTLPVGEVSDEGRRLLTVPRESLDRAIALCRPGRRIGDLGAAVQAHVEAAGFGVVRSFVGHG